MNVWSLAYKLTLIHKLALISVITVRRVDRFSQLLDSTLLNASTLSSIILTCSITMYNCTYISPKGRVP